MKLEFGSCCVTCGIRCLEMLSFCGIRLSKTPRLCQGKTVNAWFLDRETSPEKAERDLSTW